MAKEIDCSREWEEVDLYIAAYNTPMKAVIEALREIAEQLNRLNNNLESKGG